MLLNDKYKDFNYKDFNYKDFNQYVDNTFRDNIIELLGEKYKDRIKLYNFSKNICNEYRIDDIFKENIGDKAKSEIEYFYNNINKKNEDYFFHHMDSISKKPKKPSDNLKKLTYFSYKLAEDFAIKNKTFYIKHDLKLSSNRTSKLINDIELIEFHTYILKNQQNMREGDLSIHMDDMAAVNYDTITLIWYLYKSDDVKGGNIIFYNHAFSYNQTETLLKIFNDSSKQSNENKCICLIFTGDIYHAPEELSGTGMRKSIVFQFRRENRKKKSYSKIKHIARSLSLPSKKTRKTRDILKTKKQPISLN